MSNVNYYLVRAINNAKALQNFFKRNVVAIGWSGVDLSAYKTIDKVFEDKGFEALKRISPQAAGKHKGQIKKFLNIKEGDWIVVPCWSSICLCKAKGNLRYNDSAKDIDQANEHEVEFLKDDNLNIIKIPRSQLSEGLQRRLRVRGITVNSLLEFSEELQKHIDSDLSGQLYSWADEILQKKSEREESFQKTLLKNIAGGKTHLQTGGYGLEKLVEELLVIEGYKASVLSKRTFKSFADADVVATKIDRFSEYKILVQVKHHQGETGSWGIKQLLEIKSQMPEEYEDHRLIFITSAKVSAETEKEAGDNDVILLDGKMLVEWIFEHVDKLSELTLLRLGIIQTPQVVN